MAGRPSEEVMEKRRIRRDPIFYAAVKERDRILSEIRRIDTFLAVHDELAAIPPGHA